MRLIIGTVQFGVNYGINNVNGIPSDLEISKILELAERESICFLDTSIAYGDAEIKLGNYSHKFNIITKSKNISESKELFYSFDKSQKNLKNKIHGYLIHNADNLLTIPNLWDKLVELKSNKLVNKIGYSVYTCSQLKNLIENNYIPDIIQLPYNILDRKFEKYFEFLKKSKVEIHARSIFLQGLFFKNTNNFPENLKPLKKYFNELKLICKNYDVSLQELAINFVYLNKFIDKIVIGIDSELQLRKNISMLKTFKKNQNLFFEINKLKVKEQYLLNPTNWK